MKPRPTAALLAAEGVAFLLAALVHGGVLTAGYEDMGATIAESVIGTVLLAGAVATLLRPEWARNTALATQAFALAGVQIGLAVGPRTSADIAYHVGIAWALIAGILFAAGR